MQKYIIKYESSQWCGGGSYVVVNAYSREEAEEKAGLHMEEAMRELFSSEYAYALEEEDGGDIDEDSSYTVNSIQVLDADSEYWEFYKDPGQAEFYPEIS